jgi:hypothetical protein
LLRSKSWILLNARSCSFGTERPTHVERIRVSRKYPYVATWLFGVLVVATVTAIGTGTVRDLLLDQHSVFSVAGHWYLGIISTVALSTILYTVDLQSAYTLST